jgi:hypothetical protein
VVAGRWIRVIQIRRMRQEGYVTRMRERRNAYKILEKDN